MFNFLQLIWNKDDFSKAFEGESADGEGTEGGKKKRKGNAREKKEPTEEEAKMESNDGDEEGREVDYISSEDQSSESEFEPEKEVAAKEEVVFHFTTNIYNCNDFGSIL